MNTLPAVRAFRHAWSPIAHHLRDAADADARFDGGEWSTQFHVNHCFAERERVLHAVASRYGLTAVQLDDAITADEIEFEKHHPVARWMHCC